MGSKITRREVLKTGLGAGALALGGPAILSYGQGEQPIKIGFIDPETGTYAIQGDSEIRGAKMAVAEINAKHGMLGRQVQLFVEDSAADTGIAAQKAHKLIDQDKVTFLAGSVSSAVVAHG